MSTDQWRDEAWRATALAWAEDRLAEKGLSVIGAVEQPHIRPWATVFRINTERGPVWLKASAGESAYEPALIDVLRRVDSKHLLEPLALDVDRGWSLQPEGGLTLRRLLEDEREDRFARWEEVLPAYAEVQRESADLLPELLAAGVPDMRPQALARHVERILGTYPMDDELKKRVAAWLPRLSSSCRELETSRVPAMIQHDDLHDANVLVHEYGYRFFDWGDASVAHPFGSFLIIRRSIAHHAAIDVGSPELDRLADCYLEAFTDLAPPSQLRRDLQLAEYVAGVGRVESWRRALVSATEAELEEYEHPVTAWLDHLASTDPPAASQH